MSLATASGWPSRKSRPVGSGARGMKRLRLETLPVGSNSGPTPISIDRYGARFARPLYYIHRSY
jgi:hypothetical protein